MCVRGGVGGRGDIHTLPPYLTHTVARRLLHADMQDLAELLLEILHLLLLLLLLLLLHMLLHMLLLLESH